MFITTWCSNDAPDSSVPRTRSKTKFTPKVRDLLFHCRYEIVDIVDEGYDMPASIGFYNDIIREFVTDDFCLTSLFEDNGQDSNNIQHRNDGCIWSIFDRLMNTNKFRDFDVIQGTFDTLQIIFFTNHESANNFIKNNLPRFMQTLHKLIACSNFFIQAKSFKFLNELFTAQTNYETRSLWMAEPAFIKLVVLAIQSNKHAVRSRAVSILEIFIRNPRNSPEVHEFIGRNRNVLIAFFFNSAPIHYYQGSPNEKEDAQYARMAYKLLNWDMQRPFTQEQLQDFEEGWTHQKKMREEQLVRTCFHDNNPRLPKVNHVYRTRIIPNQQFLREPLKFGNPFRQ
uniref:MO25-like protein 3 n=2 Tax=Caenorhabditis elegans TaxID=6239 RepID=MO25L_CAEEL|nr:RecName: Full=MO25-like protein 3 [Caenorhabditis elegans]